MLLNWAALSSQNVIRHGWGLYQKHLVQFNVLKYLSLYIHERSLVTSTLMNPFFVFRV